MSNYTPEQHKIIQGYAVALYFTACDPDYPEHNQIKIDRINAVPVDFDNIFDFGLDAGKIRQLCQFAQKCGIDNPAFETYNRLSDEVIAEFEISQF
jgi:hypothetical protein